MAQKDRIYIAWHSREGASSKGWDHPEWGHGFEWDRAEVYRVVARQLERARVDMIVFSDTIDVAGRSADEATGCLETTTLVATIADVTERIGLSPAIDIEFYRPFMTARLISTLDHLSAGRIGWTVQPLVSDAAKAAFGSFLPFPESKADRIRRAEEFFDVCRRLWNSWETDAVVGDYETGAFANPEKVHEIAHAGEFYSSRGPLNTVPLPQGQPVAVMCPKDDNEADYAARFAETIILSGNDTASLVASVVNMRAAVKAAGRGADEVILLVPVRPVIAASDEGAQIVAADLIKAYGASQSSVQVGGTPDEVCSAVQALLSETQADGIAIDAIWLPNYIATIAAYLITPLQRRGKMPFRYEHETLRDNLALPSPISG